MALAVMAAAMGAAMAAAVHALTTISPGPVTTLIIRSILAAINMITKVATLQELFSRPNRWTKETDARNAAGEIVEYNSQAASAWCLTAAIRKVYWDEGKREEMTHKLVDWIRANLDPGIEDLPSWNDAPERKFGDIRKAIVGTNV
jgi:hypothetical protein